ncbi:hypothetical protein [Oceanobacillus salinisoli]|uniref:hypothetical protein n=1 Tax=Oceanobacillus salinisoli TaxID=2678611 RepID=UPI001E345070|nr:hypothetical protein [Oceanobacillus salinisoli]
MIRTVQGRKILFVAGIVFALLIVILFFSLFFFSSGRQAKNTVETFYEYEQQGYYSESWEMFHPYMQEKFQKGHYMEDRPHVFRNHFGVDTFSFSIGDVKKVNDWIMEEGKEPIDTAYRVTVYQGFSGKYGRFTITQHVYATETEDDWKILWDYAG